MLLDLRSRIENLNGTVKEYSKYMYFARSPGRLSWTNELNNYNKQNNDIIDLNLLFGRNYLMLLIIELRILLLYTA